MREWKTDFKKSVDEIQSDLDKWDKKQWQIVLPAIALVTTLLTLETLHLIPGYFAVAFMPLAITASHIHLLFKKRELMKIRKRIENLKAERDGKNSD